jgi:AcrR family transcriptional regulator
VTDVKPPVPRRERLRAATQDELVAAARELLVAGGVEAVTLRSIAGQLGMTAPAIYRYFDSREALLNTLVDSLYDELADYLLTVRDAAQSLTDRFVLTSRAFREWALAHRAEFGLLFGAPVPGVGHAATEGGKDTDRGMRFARVWLDLFIELAESNNRPMTWRRPISAALNSQITDYVNSIGGVVSVEVALLYLSCWERLYGAVCTETFGHLAFAVDDGAELFEDQLLDVAERLGL